MQFKRKIIYMFLAKELEEIIQERLIPVQNEHAKIIQQLKQDIDNMESRYNKMTKNLTNIDHLKSQHAMELIEISSAKAASEEELRRIIEQKNDLINSMQRHIGNSVAAEDVLQLQLSLNEITEENERLNTERNTLFADNEMFKMQLRKLGIQIP